MKSRLIALLAVALAIPQAAQAHLVVSGMGPVYDGISHFGLSPEDFLPVIAFGFFAGFCGKAQARWSLFALISSWIAGGCAAMEGAALAPLSASIATAAIFLAVGGLLSFNRPLPPAWCAGIAALLGALRGLGDLSGVSAGFAHFLALTGMAASVFVVFALAVSITLPLQRLWMIVAARVGGSWLAALGLLLVGWIVRYGPVIH